MLRGVGLSSHLGSGNRDKLLQFGPEWLDLLESGDISMTECLLNDYHNTILATNNVILVFSLVPLGSVLIKLQAVTEV